MADAFRSREESLLARNAQLEADLAAERRRAEVAERAVSTAKAFDAVNDVHVGIARGLLWATVVGYGLFVLISFPAYIGIAHSDPGNGPWRDLDPTLVGVGMALVVDVFFLPVALGALAGAIGLRRGQRWGYVGAVIAFSVLALFCTPIGAYGLFAFLRERVRHVFYPPYVPPVRPPMHAGWPGGAPPPMPPGPFGAPPGA